MKAFQSYLPIVLSMLFFGLIAVFAAQKLLDWNGLPLVLGSATLVVYLMWLFIESRIALGELDKGATRIDRGTLELYALGRAFTVLTALGLPAHTAQSDVRLFSGLCLLMLGIGLRFYAIRTLGKFYSHRVRVDKQHQIVNNGPYRLLRHPSYTGMLVAHAGFIAVFFNWVSLAIFLFFFIPAVVARILVEEKAMEQVAGYLEFSRTRKRLFPGIW